MMRWALLAAAVLVILLVGAGAWVGVPFYQKVSPFTDELVDVAERARVENLPDEEIRTLLKTAARRHEIEIAPKGLLIEHPEPGAVHIKLTALGHPFGKDGIQLTMNLETRRP